MQTTEKTIKHDGDTWRILGIGVTRLLDSGASVTYLHLASTTRGSKQRNGKMCPIQMADWLPSALLASRSQTMYSEAISAAIAESIATNKTVMVIADALMMAAAIEVAKLQGHYWDWLDADLLDIRGRIGEQTWRLHLDSA